MEKSVVDTTDLMKWETVYMCNACSAYDPGRECIVGVTNMRFSAIGCPWGIVGTEPVWKQLETRYKYKW